MATDDPITVIEGNDETIAVTITRDTDGEALTAVATVEFVLKHDSCDDDDATTLTLTSADPAELVIDTQTADLIEARAFIPAAWLSGGYSRFYRVDAVTAGGDRRTALYGTVTVVNV